MPDITRPMAQNYDPKTGIAVMGACMEGCGPGCVPTCVLDRERHTRMIFSEPGIEMKFNERHARVMDAYREARAGGMTIADAHAEALRVVEQDEAREAGADA